MKKSHSILKKCLVICVLVLGVGTAAYLLLNRSDDKDNDIIQVSEQPVDDDFFVAEPSYSWCCKHIIKEAGILDLALLAVVPIVIIILGIGGIYSHSVNIYLAAALVCIVGIYRFLPRVKKPYDQYIDLHRDWFQAASKGDLKLIKSLLAQEKVDIDAKNKYGDTALHLSALYGHLECVQYLVEQEADIEAINNHEGTALHFSAVYGDLDCVQYLVEKGANIDATNNGGYTPLHLSTVYGHLDCVQYLVERAHSRYKNEHSNKRLFLHPRYKGPLGGVQPQYQPPNKPVALDLLADRFVSSRVNPPDEKYAL